MKLEPVKKYEKPVFPEKREVMRNPTILKSLPERWKSNASVCVALTSLLALTFTGCGSKFAGMNRVGEGGNDNTNTMQYTNKSGSSNKGAFKDSYCVAPVFKHGEGRGSFGCVSVAPPAFLSEEEAFKVIQEEAIKSGIKFEKTTPILYKVNIPETKYYLKGETSGYKQNGGEINTTKSKDLILDGYNIEKNIAFEFVSKQDYDDWSVKENLRSSVDDFDFLSTASLLQKSLSTNNEKINLGVFYNPMIRYTEDAMKVINSENDWKKKEQIAKEMVSDELREQVKDFIKWLKAQEII